MARSSKENQCELLCKEIARLRAGGRCEMTGEPTNETHHVFYGSATPWQLRYNPTYFLCLAGGPHRLDKKSPHVDNEAFLKILRTDSRFRGIDHIEKILEAVDDPPAADIKPDWNILHRALKEECRRWESMAWMDDTQIEPGRMCA